MPEITKVVRNSTRSFFGGAGSVIPFRPKSTEYSTKNSKSEEQSSALQQDLIDQLNQEDREQWGYQPEMDESGTSNNES